MKSTGNIYLKRKPPFVIPVRFPSEIEKDILDLQDRGAFIEHIINYQKSQTDWDVYRKKIPDKLLEKIKQLLFECRKNGFINPHVREGKLYWNQIMGHERNYKQSDNCTLCDNSFQSGSCKGKAVNNHLGHRDFKPCWAPT